MNIIPHPAIVVDMHLAEITALLALMRSVAENVDDDEWLARRHDFTTSLYAIADKIGQTAKPMAHLTRLQRAS